MDGPSRKQQCGKERLIKPDSRLSVMSKRKSRCRLSAGIVNDPYFTALLLACELRGLLHLGSDWASWRAYDSLMENAHVLHWLPLENRWEHIPWSDWSSFRAIMEPFVPLKGIAGGLHYFAVCIKEEGATLNIIGHKYLIEPNGQIGNSNFYGWTKEERDDYQRLMLLREMTSEEEKRLRVIQDKGGNAMYPPRESLYALIHALPHPPAHGSAATLFLDAVIAGVSRSELEKSRSGA